MGTVRPLIAGNWKMNGTVASATRLLAAVRAGTAPGADLLVCPPATLIAMTAQALAGSGVGVGAQDCHPKPPGAHTGDLAAVMLADAGATHVILGHSERRQDHGETDRLVHDKTLAALAANLTPIVCVGETRAEREAGRAEAVVGGQLAGSLPEGFAAAGAVVAYEPVWAIGTGLVASEAEVGAMHAFIRARLVERFGAPGRAVRILYGGSVKPGNAASLLAVAEVNGALVGGASLVADDFLAIARAVPGR